MIGHAHGIDALDHTADRLRYGQHFLLGHPEVPDYIDAGIGGYEGYLVELVIPEESF